MVKLFYFLLVAITQFVLFGLLTKIMYMNLINSITSAIILLKHSKIFYRFYHDLFEDRPIEDPLTI
jgi:hypothetical protein